MEHSVMYRFIVGMLIGSGFILPGISGGALAAIFGIYERIIGFLANISKNFKENVVYFLPVGLGALAGIVILSFGVSFLFNQYETIILWFFVGAIVGSAPALWREAGKQGRSQKDYIMLIVAFIVGFTVLKFGQTLLGGRVEASFGAWLIAGALIALGILIPGLSPSNFIVYMGLYEAMSDGFKSIDLGVIIPIALGGLGTILLLSKLIEWIFSRYYSLFFHFIFGIVLASTLLIIPIDYSGFRWLQFVLCGIMLVLGTLLGLWMSKLEAIYK